MSSTDPGEVYVFYHGTVVTSANEILRRVDISCGRQDLDFGPGFYTTRLRAQADEWATALGDAQREDPAVVEIIVRKTDYLTLRPLVFPPGWSPAWERMVRAGVSGQIARDRIFTEDVVDGPFLRTSSGKNRKRLITGELTGADEVRPGGDQQVWATDAAEKVLNGSLRRRLP